MQDQGGVERKCEVEYGQFARLARTNDAASHGVDQSVGNRTRLAENLDVLIQTTDHGATVSTSWLLRRKHSDIVRRVTERSRVAR